MIHLLSTPFGLRDFSREVGQLLKDEYAGQSLRPGVMEEAMVTRMAHALRGRYVCGADFVKQARPLMVTNLPPSEETFALLSEVGPGQRAEAMVAASTSGSFM